MSRAERSGERSEAERPLTTSGAELKCRSGGKAGGDFFCRVKFFAFLPKRVISPYFWADFQLFKMPCILSGFPANCWVFEGLNFGLLFFLNSFFVII